MKTFRKTLSLLMVLFLTAGLLPHPVRAAEDDHIHLTFHYDNPLYLESAGLSQDQQTLNAEARASIAEDAELSAAVSQLRAAIKARQDQCAVEIQTNGYDEESFRSLIHQIAELAEAHTGVPTEGDYIMWQYGGWDCSASGSASGSVYSWTLTYTYEYYTTAQEEAQVDSKVKSVLNSLGVSTASDYEKVKAVYDYICDNVTYDNAHLSDSSYKHQFTAYGALVDGTSVCQGYAVLFYRLALELGVDARLISGSSRGEGHGWNIVELGNKYYNADTTWDAGNTSYTYFLKCPANFPDHTRDAAYDTTDFHNAYPMATADYQPGTETECSHSYASVVTEPSCTATGYTTHTCILCGDTYTDAETPKTDHSWDTGTVTKDPSTTETGIRTFTCTVCQATREESIPMLEDGACQHSHQASILDATCTEDGLATYTCTKCGETTTEIIEKLGHDYQDVVTEPTCAAGGYTLHICSRCSDSYTDSETAALPHTWDEGTVTQEPTDTEPGIMTYECINCDATKTESITCSHTNYSSVTTEPTCTAEGQTVYTCTNCGYSYTETIAKLPHQWDEGAITKEPTATEAGEKTQHCANCDNVRITKIPATGGVLRLQGANRYETAFKAADLIKTSLTADKFYNIVITSGTNYADALSGSYLATQYQAPILLVNQHTVQDVADYIFENAHPGARIFILGGEVAVPAAMDELLENDFDVRRLAGANRYETNLLILQEAGINTSEIMVCTGRDFADSLSVSALGKPILLVNKILTDSQKAWLSSMVSSNFNTVHIIGGTNAVAANMEAEFTDMGFQTVDRISGSNRYETSLKVAQTLLPLEPDNLILAYGQNYPDGLCGGVLAYFRNAPLILVKENVISYAKEYTETYGLTNGAVLGGPGLISDSAVQKIFGSDPILYP